MALLILTNLLDTLTSPLFITFIKIIYMIGDLNFKEVEEVLQDQLIGRIGCHSNGITYIVPVSYAYNELSYAYNEP